MPLVNCQNCRTEFIVRQADLNRGWGKFCSKSCKAKSQFKTHPNYPREATSDYVEDFDMSWGAHKDSW